LNIPVIRKKQAGYKVNERAAALPERVQALNEDSVRRNHAAAAVPEQPSSSSTAQPRAPPQTLEEVVRHREQSERIYAWHGVHARPAPLEKGMSA